MREQLLNLVWGFDYIGGPRTVDVHVRRLRSKIEKDPDNLKQRVKEMEDTVKNSQERYKVLTDSLQSF